MKIEIVSTKHKVEKIEEELRRNRNVIFSMIINDEENTKETSVLKKCMSPFNRVIGTYNSCKSEYGNKVYFLISRDINIPFSDSNILAISKDKNKILEQGIKKIKEYIFTNNYHSLLDFKTIKDVEIELIKKGKVEFSTDKCSNIKKELRIKEKYLI